jgi:hypothetical protein
MVLIGRGIARSTSPRRLSHISEYWRSGVTPPGRYASVPDDETL